MVIMVSSNLSFSHLVPPIILGLTSSAPNASNKIIRPRTGSVSVNISCAVNRTASPVTFQWTLNSGTVQSSTRSFIDISSNQVVSQLYLVISSVSSAHGGTYRCTTSNHVGNDYQELTLTVVGRYGGIEWIMVILIHWHMYVYMHTGMIEILARIYTEVSLKGYRYNPTCFDIHYKT